MTVSLKPFILQTFSLYARFECVTLIQAEDECHESNGWTLCYLAALVILGNHFI